MKISEIAVPHQKTFTPRDQGVAGSCLLEFLDEEGRRICFEERQLASRRLAQHDQQVLGRDIHPLFGEYFRHCSVARADDCRLHLHRLDPEQRFAG